jgi:hypothetical protein
MYKSAWFDTEITNNVRTKQDCLNKLTDFLNKLKDDSPNGILVIDIEKTWFPNDNGAIFNLDAIIIYYEFPEKDNEHN